jgi:hypothetical protein
MKAHPGQTHGVSAVWRVVLCLRDEIKQSTDQEGDPEINLSTRYGACKEFETIRSDLETKPLDPASEPPMTSRNSVWA